MRNRSEFSTVRVVGGLLPSALLERVGAEDPDLEAINPADYYLAPGERLGEAITRSWNRLVGLWNRFDERLDSDDPQVGATRQEWLLPLFQELGYGHLANAPSFEFESKSYPISHVWESIPIHVLGVGVDLNTRSSGVAGAASSTPHGLVQEFLNRSDNHLWAILSNGVQLRLLRDNASLTRNAYVEFDLRELFSDKVYSDFALLWLTCHASRLEGPAGKQVLESWRADAAKRGVRALDALRDGVESAIETLGSAVISHSSNAEVRHQLEAGSLDAQELYRQLLRVVYRLLFLLVAEARGLLFNPSATEESRARYSVHFSMSRLRDLAEATRGGGHSDLWAQHLTVAKALESDGASDLGLPALGGFLWASESTPALNRAKISNESLLSAIRSLTRVKPRDELPQRVDYANLGPEELGSVYESLLEYTPEINQLVGSFMLKTAAGNERKTTGSYYTPTALIDELLDSSLDPVVEQAARSDNPEQAVLNLKVVDPAAGSGHFLIAAANRIADRLARIRSIDEEPSPEELGAAVRDVIAHCIYAVDVNPMAVELAKVALWLEGMEPGKPLTFLDHHIVCGNSLLGVTPRLLEEGIPNEAFAALTGDNKEHVKGLKARNRGERKKRLVALPFGDSPDDLLSHAAAELAEIDAMGDGSLSDVEEKRRRHDKLIQSSEQRRLRLAADTWVAAFVAPKTLDHPAITHAVVNIALSDPDRLSHEVADSVEALRGELRFHHWQLSFPDVFSEERGDRNDTTGWFGGFDVVLGNPPWERVKLQEKEYFATSSPDVATAPNKAARTRLINQLREESPQLWEGFHRALQRSEAVSHFLRKSGVYPLCGRGDINTYTVFAEGMRHVIGTKGRTGVIVPTGIATDDTTRHFFSDLIDQKSLVSLFGFYDRKQIFQSADVHGFCLLTMSGRDFPTDEPEFVFFARSIHEMHDPERRFTLTTGDFALLNPNTRTCPIFRNRRDAEITKGVYRRVSVLVEENKENGNPWGITFQRMFDMSNDSHLFRTRDQLEADGLSLLGNEFVRDEERYQPLYEAKMIHHFNHRWATYDGEDIGSITLDELRDPYSLPMPRYWVNQDDVHKRLSDPDATVLLGFRDIARATDERTTIASLVPIHAVGNKLPLLNPSVGKPECLAAVLSSFPLDFVARQKVGSTSLNFFIVKQFAVLTPESMKEGCPWDDRPIEEWVSDRANELARSAADLSMDNGVIPWDSARRDLLRAELDAAFFYLYGFGRDDVDYVMETFPVIKRRDTAEHGSYRTKELILSVYDRLVEATETGDAYQTILDPPPSDPSLWHPISEPQ